MKFIFQTFFGCSTRSFHSADDPPVQPRSRGPPVRGRPVIREKRPEGHRSVDGKVQRRRSTKVDHQVSSRLMNYFQIGYVELINFKRRIG